MDCMVTVEREVLKLRWYGVRKGSLKVGRNLLCQGIVTINQEEGRRRSYYYKPSRLDPFYSITSSIPTMHIQLLAGFRMRSSTLVRAMMCRYRELAVVRHPLKSEKPINI